MTFKATPIDAPYRLLSLWLMAAALGQLCYLAGWPMYLGGMRVGELPAMAVAFVRLGLYSGLAWGIERRDAGAQAATVLELLRSFVLFALLARLRGDTLAGAIYPAGWVQGALGGVLPLLVVLNALLTAGWGPAVGLARNAHWLAGLAAAGAGITALWLQREPLPGEVAADGRPPRSPGWLPLLREGLPYTAVLTSVEIAAVILSLQ